MHNIPYTSLISGFPRNKFWKQSKSLSWQFWQMIPHSAINLASGFEFSVILILPNNICWCFPVFEYFQWQQFLVNALSEEMPREDMSVVVGYFVKRSETD